MFSPTFSPSQVPLPKSVLSPNWASPRSQSAGQHSAPAYQSAASSSSYQQASVFFPPSYSPVQAGEKDWNGVLSGDVPKLNDAGNAVSWLQHVQHFVETAFNGKKFTAPAEISVVKYILQNAHAAERDHLLLFIDKDNLQTYRLANLETAARRFFTDNEVKRAWKKASEYERPEFAPGMTCKEKLMELKKRAVAANVVFSTDPTQQLLVFESWLTKLDMGNLRQRCYEIAAPALPNLHTLEQVCSTEDVIKSLKPPTPAPDSSPPGELIHVTEKGGKKGKGKKKPSSYARSQQQWGRYNDWNNDWNWNANQYRDNSWNTGWKGNSEWQNDEWRAKRQPSGSKKGSGKSKANLSAANSPQKGYKNVWVVEVEEETAEAADDVIEEK